MECCASAAELADTIRRAPVAVVQVRALALPSMFSRELAVAASSLPYEVLCMVTPPEAAETVLGGPAALGEALVFARGKLVGRISRAALDPGQALLGLLRAGLSPWLERVGSPQWDDDENDPFADDAAQ
jgi:hypothetical protein